MIYDKVSVRQIPDDVSLLTGLNKYNRSKMPGTVDSFPASVGPDGRYVTGIDEDAYSVSLIKDEEEKTRVQKALRELRESLQKATGNPDLTATSRFWEDFRVKINSDTELILVRANPMDVIAFHLLVANGYAAPNKDAASNPTYRRCKYYCHVEEIAEQEDVSTQKQRDQARSALYNISEKYDHLLLVGQYLLGDKIKKGMKPDTIYRNLSEFINSNYDNLKSFAKAATLDVSNLQYKITVDRAVKKRIIKISKDGYFQRGQVTLGKSLSEVYSNLKKPEFAIEFQSIRDEIEGA